MPQWERFIAACTTCPEDSPWEGDMFSPDRHLLFAWMGWYPEVRHEKILLDSVQWESCQDFEVLYWKHLPLVHRVTFLVESAEPRWKSYKVPEWFDAWWTQSLHWHKQPWELPSWPSE